MDKSLPDIFATYPVDEANGQDWKRRETNRARILSENLEKARPYIDRQPPQPDELLENKQHSENAKLAVSWLIKQVDGDVISTMIIILITKFEYDYRDSQALAEKCNVSVQQITASKERIRYKCKCLGAPKFEELLQIVSERFASNGR